MQNNKILKQRAALYDNLLTCTYNDCGAKFSRGGDLELHIKTNHHVKLTCNEWWNKFQKILFQHKDDLWVSDAKNGVNEFTWGEMVEAGKELRKMNIR